MLGAILAARRDARLSWVQVAKRMGTKAWQWCSWKRRRLSGTPSLSTLRKYAAALGKRVRVQLVSL